MSRPYFLFAPGAGAPSTSPWMTGWAVRLGQLGDVRMFDYPYQRAKKKRPDPQERLIQAHREEIGRARREAKGPLVLVGKSMGSRIGCHASLEESLQALVCFGYPLKSPAGKLRDEVLLALTTPILFLQGTRDPLCPLEELEKVRARMKARNELFVVEGGNHSLEILKRQGPQEAVDARIAQVIEEFLRPA